MSVRFTEYGIRLATLVLNHKKRMVPTEDDIEDVGAQFAGVCDQLEVHVRKLCPRYRRKLLDKAVGE